MALATLAIGIGANAAVYSLAEGMLLRPLPFRERSAWRWSGSATSRATARATS